MTSAPEPTLLPPEQIALSFFRALVISIRKLAKLVLTITNHNQKVKKGSPTLICSKADTSYLGRKETQDSKHRTAGISALFM